MNSKQKNNTFFVLSISIVLFLLCYNIINAEEKIKIYADEVSVDKIGEKIIATGDAVAINEDNVKIKSNQLTYDKSKNFLEAKGNVILIDQSDNGFFLDELNASDNFNIISGKAVKARLHDESRIVGSKFEKKDAISIVENAEYTPCTEENYLIKNCPGWKLKSKKIYHDTENRTIHYDHAQLQLFNIPVFYLPYFSHPDPSVKKRSGFLMPTIQTDNQLGETFSIPIFLNLSSNRDITFTPNIQTAGNNFYNFNYRHLNDLFDLEINSSIDDNDDNTGTSNHLFFESKIINPYGNLNTYLKTTNNDTYMRKNKINNLTVLKSGVEFDREVNDTFFSIETIGYKHLTTEGQQWEYLYPNIIYDINNIDNNIYSGNVSLNNKLSFRKNLNENYVSLASSQINWSNQKINKNFGLIFNNEANLRVTSISIDEKSRSDTSNIRIYPQYSLKISYPLLKSSSLFNQTLTPIIMPIVAPYNNYTEAQTVTNSNLFSTNRATSISEWESGPRINYGIEWFINSVKGTDIRTVIGQNYRFNKLSDDTASEISDYFINSNININSENYLDSSLIIDRDDLKIRSLNANTFNRFGDLIFALNYDYTSGKYSAPAEQVAIGGKYELENNLFIKFTGTKNLDTNKNIGYQYGILYENDCLGIDFNYYRDLTKDRDIEESDGFSFTVVLKPFGSTKNYGKNIVFGPRI
jgi:LPS-assembly protein